MMWRAMKRCIARGLIRLAMRVDPPNSVAVPSAQTLILGSVGAVRPGDWE